MSIQALGLSPVICAAIAVHLFAPVVPALQAELASGKPGGGRIGRYTLLGTLAFALVEGIGHAGALASAGQVAEPDAVFLLGAVATLVGTSLFLAWLADRIGQLEFGNGVLILIAAWVIWQLPANLSALLELVRIGAAPPRLALGVALALGAQLFLVVVVARARRRIALVFDSAQGAGRSHGDPPPVVLPIAVAGVLPALFAVYVVGYLASGLEAVVPAGFGAAARAEGTLGLAATAVLIPGLAFYLAALFFEPRAFAGALARAGLVVPGIALGAATAVSLDGVATRLTAIPAGFLCLVCLVPAVLRQWLDPSYGLALVMPGYDWLLPTWVLVAMLGRIRSGEDRDAPDAS